VLEFKEQYVHLQAAMQAYFTSLFSSLKNYLLSIYMSPLPMPRNFLTV
jgi:hypothetical protein